MWVVSCVALASAYAGIANVISGRRAVVESAEQTRAASVAEAQARAAAWHAHLKRADWDKAHPAEVARRKAAERARQAAQARATAAEAAADARANANADAEQKREARIPMHEYWDAQSKALDTATAVAHDAAAAVDNGDYVTASQDFSACADDANDALMSADNDVPDGWQDVADSLGVAADQLMRACKEAVTALDDQKPSELAAFQSDMAQFKEAQFAAVAKAAQKWIAAGGDLKNI